MLINSFQLPVPFSEIWFGAFVRGFVESEATMPTFTVPVNWRKIVVVTIVLQIAIMEDDSGNSDSCRNRFLDARAAMLLVDDSNVNDDVYIVGEDSAKNLSLVSIFDESMCTYLES